MSPESGQPNSHHEAMLQAVDDAREAAIGDDLSKIRDSRYTENGVFKQDIKADRYSDYPLITTSKSELHDSVDAFADTDRYDPTTNDSQKAETTTTYHAHIDSAPRTLEERENGTVRASTDVVKTDENGNIVYTHRFKNPDTARKFAELIARQITRRAEKAGTEEKAA